MVANPTRLGRIGELLTLSAGQNGGPGVSPHKKTRKLEHCRLGIKRQYRSKATSTLKKPPSANNNRLIRPLEASTNEKECKMSLQNDEYIECWNNRQGFIEFDYRNYGDDGQGSDELAYAETQTNHFPNQGRYNPEFFERDDHNHEAHWLAQAEVASASAANGLNFGAYNQTAQEHCVSPSELWNDSGSVPAEVEDFVVKYDKQTLSCQYTDCTKTFQRPCDRK
jgi:hypothetical protein